MLIFFVIFNLILICHLSGQEAFFVGSLTRDPSFSWKTAHHASLAQKTANTLLFDSCGNGHLWAIFGGFFRLFSHLISHYHKKNVAHLGMQLFHSEFVIKGKLKSEQVRFKTLQERDKRDKGA